MKVLKFGGTSLGSSDSIKRAIDCIKLNSDEKSVIVLSAFSATTDKLLEVVNNSVSNLDKSLEILTGLKLHHLKILSELVDNNNIDTSKIDSYFRELEDKINAFNILGELTPHNIDSILSYGELLSTTIFHIYTKYLKLDFQLIDSRDFIKTDSNFTCASIDFDKTKLEFSKNRSIFEENQQIIAQGFIASDCNNKTTTLGRGGSDYSASIYANILKSIGFNVQELQIWTDVAGIYSADPRIVKSAFTIGNINNSEIRTLSYLGAKVLHPDTIKPAIMSKIPIRVLNTFSPEEKGTKIEVVNHSKSRINSIIQIENCTLIVVNNSSNDSGFVLLQNLLALSQKISNYVLYSDATEDSITLIVKYYYDILLNEELLEQSNLERISCIAITGNRVVEHLGRVLKVADEFQLNFVGFSKNCIFLSSADAIDNEVFEKIHNRLFLG